MAKTSRHSHANVQTSHAARLPLLDRAARLIGLRLDEFLAYEPFLASPDRVYELHEMRIAAKRLRYTMEIFQDAYTLHTRVGAEFAQSLEAVKAIQEYLGALHDADVLVPRLLEHLGYILRDGYGTHSSEEDSRKDSQKEGFDTEGFDMEGRPIAGVHRVDYDACRGLLNLCTQTRDGRDASYGQLLEAWRTMKAARQFDRLRDLLTGKGIKEETSRQAGKENAVTGENAFGDGMVPASALPALSLPAASSQDVSKETFQATFQESSQDTSARTAKETDAHDAVNRQNAQVRRAPGEPGHVAAARRRANAERGGQGNGESGSEGRGSGSRKPDRGEPKAEQAGETSEGNADQSTAQTVDGAFVIRDAKHADRAAKHAARVGGSKSTRGKDGGKNARPRSATRRKDASRPA